MVERPQKWRRPIDILAPYWGELLVIIEDVGCFTTYSKNGGNLLECIERTFSALGTKPKQWYIARFERGEGLLILKQGKGGSIKPKKDNHSFNYE